MNIKIIAIGTIKDKWLKEGVVDFSKRIKKYCNLEIIEKTDASDSLPLKKALDFEANEIIPHLNQRSKLILLDLHGKQMTSEEFARNMPEWFVDGSSEIIFIIGGSRGLSDLLTKRIKTAVCLSCLTFTHLLTRLILLEQIYRAFKINRNEPYHK